MTVPRVCVLRAPGTNCDVETAFAFETCGAVAERLHLFRLLENPRKLAEFQILCLPGGFSYGDDIGAGVIFSQQFLTRLREACGEFLERADTLALGICNGFQVLLKAGILPGGAEGWQENRPAERNTTLTWNDNGKYTATWVHLQNGAPQSVFLRGIDHIELPVAHAEGKIVVRGEEEEGVIAGWKNNGQIALRYSRPENSVADENGTADSLLPYPLNPNGSVENVAALSDPSGRVLGMMPHPERFIHATQHPRWTRERLNGDGDGLKLFQNAVSWFE